MWSLSACSNIGSGAEQSTFLGPGASPSLGAWRRSVRRCASGLPSGSPSRSNIRTDTRLATTKALDQFWGAGHFQWNFQAYPAKRQGSKLVNCIYECTTESGARCRSVGCIRWTIRRGPDPRSWSVAKPGAGTSLVQHPRRKFNSTGDPRDATERRFDCPTVQKWIDGPHSQWKGRGRKLFRRADTFCSIRRLCTVEWSIPVCSCV
jgi:hypothetical protein